MKYYALAPSIAGLQHGSEPQWLICYNLGRKKHVFANLYAAWVNLSNEF